MKSGVSKRLVYLFTGELFSVIVFTFIYFTYFSITQSYSLIYSLIILNFILLQGSFYWVIKWRRLKSKSRILPNLYKLLVIFKRMNMALICIMPLILIIDIVVQESLPIIIIVIVYGFAIVEYINYYHIQLTNYNNRRGKKSSIAKEID